MSNISADTGENKPGITFIERKKYIPLGQRLAKLYEEFSVQQIAKNYKSEGLLWRVVYDKVYRPELYKFISSVENIKEINVVRNIFAINENKYEYKQLKENTQLDMDDDEVYTENNYLRKVHKYFLMETYSYYSTIPLVVATSFLGIASRQTK